jgi:hypothetical protein
MITNQSEKTFTPQQLVCFQYAHDTLSDEWAEDIRRLLDDVDMDFGETSMGDFLPEPFMDLYDVAFAKRFLEALAVVYFKLFSDDSLRLDSTSEELALYALLRDAEGHAESFGVEFDHEDYLDDLFEDTDFLILFSVEERMKRSNPELQRVLGEANMEFTAWFKPFRPTVLQQLASSVPPFEASE